MSNDLMTNKPERKDNRSIIYGVLAAALIGTWGYIIYDKSKSGEKIEQLQSQYTTTDSARTVVQDMYNMSLGRLDSLTGINQSLTDSLSGRNGEIAQLKNEIRGILNNKNATAAELSRARRMIEELNGKIGDLAVEVDRLKGENTQLVARNEQVTQEKQVVETNLATTTAEKQVLDSTLTSTVDIASTLHVSSIAIKALDEKKSGKEKEVEKAKNVDKLRIMFNLDPNRIAQAGEKELYVAITAPDGTPVSVPAYGSGNFNTREEGDKFFTSKVVVQYDPAKANNVSFDWKQDKKFTTGNYKIEVYHNGFKIGEGTTSLKKGLFS